MERRSWKGVAVAGCLALVLTSPALGDFVGYNSETQWRMNAGDWQLETFEGFNNLTALMELPDLGISFDELVDGTSFPTVMDLLTTGGLSHSGDNVLVNQGAPQLPGLGPIVIRPLVEGTWITAAGYWNTGGDDSTEIRFYGENDELIGSRMLMSISEQFNGGISTVPVFRVEIDAAAFGNGYFTVDDLQITIAPAPAGAYVFALLGAMSCSVATRRRQARC